MNGVQHATNSALGVSIPRGATFWVVTVAAWAAYAALLMVPWIGRYPILIMLPNKVAIAATGVAVSALLYGFYRWIGRRSVPTPVFLGSALLACALGAVAFDAVVIGLTQGPDAVLVRWDGSLGAIVGGVPVPGRVGQYAILLIAWSLGIHLVRPRPAASPAPPADAPVAADPEATIAVAGTVVRAREGHRTVLLERDEIDWIAADGDYVRIHSGAKNLLVRATMKYSSGLLAPLGFIRVHRSAIVNPRRVREIVRAGGVDEVVLRTGARIPVGRNYASRLDAILRATT